MENSFFSINRFWLYVKKSFIENKVRVRTLLLGIAAMHVGFQLFACLGNGISQSFLQTTYTIGLYLLGVLFADKALFRSKDKLRSFFLLLNPASKLEKLTAAIISSSVIFPIVYTMVFYAVNWAFYMVLNSTGLKYADILHFNISDMMENYAKLALLQAVFILGSLWFKKMSFVKTTASMVGYFVAITFFSMIFINKISIGNVDSSDIEILNLSINRTNSAEMMFQFYWLLIPFFWVVSYFRFSEKQL